MEVHSDSNNGLDLNEGESKSPNGSNRNHLIDARMISEPSFRANAEPNASTSDSDVNITEPTPSQLLPSGQFPSANVPQEDVLQNAATGTSTMQHISKEQRLSNRAPRKPRQPMKRSSTPTQPRTHRKETPGIVKQVFHEIGNHVGSMLSASPEPESAKSDVHTSLDKGNKVHHLRRDISQRETTMQLLSNAREEDANDLRQVAQDFRHRTNQEWGMRYQQLEDAHANTLHQRNTCLHALKAKDLEIISLKATIENLDAVIRGHQESSFKQMATGRWLPSEESKVMSELARIRRDVRAWSKMAATTEMAQIRDLNEADTAVLLNELSSVVVLRNNELPQGLSTPKSPSLLLNALLSHDIYTAFFTNPFFFLKDGIGSENDAPKPGLDHALDSIYHLSQTSSQEDAHNWRSQTLRLLLPPQRLDSYNGERDMRRLTEIMIAEAASRQANHFLASPARYLINTDTLASFTKKLNSIYQESAMTSYQLWTRRTTMRCTTLKDMSNPVFDIDNPHIIPHTLVHPENHDDKLKGRPFSVVVHPLLQVYGTDEAKDYDQGRVWAAAEVWLDCKDT